MSWILDIYPEIGDALFFRQPKARGRGQQPVQEPCPEDLKVWNKVTSEVRTDLASKKPLGAEELQ